MHRFLLPSTFTETVMHSIDVRKDFNDILEVMVLDDNSSSDSSSTSSDADLDILLLEAAFPQQRQLGSRLNIEDVSEMDCEEMFRYGLIFAIVPN